MIYPFVTGMGRFEYRPAYVPADYIGPRMDCPLPLRDDDSPLDGKKFDAWEFIETPVWFDELQQDVAIWSATTSGPAPVNPGLPVPPGVVFPNLPPCCEFWPGTPGNPGTVVTPPEPPQPAPVPLNGAGAYLGGTLIAAMMCAAAWRYTDRFVKAQRKAN